MEGENVIRRGFHLLAFVVLVAHLKHVSAKCPDKVITCFCPGEKFVKVKVSQCRVGETCQLCQDQDERKFCLTNRVLSLCAEDVNRKSIEGNDRQMRLPRVRRHIKSDCSQGINISDSIPEGLPIVKGERHLEDFVDRDLILKCFVYSRTPANITWVANGNRVKPGDVRCRYCISIPLGSCYQQLVIKTAETADSGDYTCVVSNKYGTVNSTSSVTVRVKRYGKISIDKVRLEGGNKKAILGGSVNITCTIIDTSDKNILVKWTKNGKRAVDDGKRQIWHQDGLSPVDKREKILILTLMNITAEDEGNFTCAAKGGWPATIQSKMFTLSTELCPGGYYCPWRENKKYPCPYGTYTDGSSNGTVLSPRDCLKCPGVSQCTKPKIGWQPAASLGGCPADCPVFNRSKDVKGAGTLLTVILLASAVGLLFVLLWCVILFLWYHHKRRSTFHPSPTAEYCATTQSKV